MNIIPTDEALARIYAAAYASVFDNIQNASIAEKNAASAVQDFIVLMTAFNTDDD